jgi:hypothetical protein
MSHQTILVSLFLLYANSSIGSSLSCGNIERTQDGTHEGMRYPTYTYTTNEGSAVIVRQDMRVNADGARTAYELNNHGISYLCDGLTAREGTNWITQKPCGFLTASAIELGKVSNNELHFSKQGPELCIFGFHVEGGKSGIAGCSGKVVGGGQADAVAPLISVASPAGVLQYFVSTTSLANRSTDVSKRYIDSEQIPFIVIPGRWQHKQISLGDYAYIYSPGELGIKQEALTGPRGSFAIVADKGPQGKFGEGSIALHQMLAFGELRSAPAYQKTANGQRHPETESIFHPYQDRGDGDIRAKGNIDKEVWYIMFAGSANKSLAQHSFSVDRDGLPQGNVYAEGANAAALFGGQDHIIACLKASENFK